MKRYTRFSGFLAYMFLAMLVLFLVFSCKSKPPVLEEPEENTETVESSEPDPSSAESGVPPKEGSLAYSGGTAAEGGAAAPQAPIETRPDQLPSVNASPVEAPPPELPLAETPSTEKQAAADVPPPPEPPVIAEPEKSPPESSPAEPAPQAQQPPPRPEAPRPPPVRQEPPPPPPSLKPAEPQPTPPVSEPAPAPTPAPPLRHDEPVVPLFPSRIAPADSEGQVVLSRIVRVTVRQLLEIPFRGTGWVYLGELGNRRGMVYDSRRLDISAGSVEGQSFIFRAEIAGTYILKFYKQDFILDYILYDHVQVIVEEPENFEPGRLIDRGRVVAEPRWPPPPDFEAAAQDSAGEAARPDTETRPATQRPQALLPGPLQPHDEWGVEPETPSLAAPPPESLPGDALPDEYVRRARQEFDAGRVEQALAIMKTMEEQYPIGDDEALWLYGQLLEANSPERDVRRAIDCYRKLVREFPQSKRVPDAQRRIAYLERYYFNIR